MAEMMKKVVMEGPKKSKIIEVPVPEINDDQMLVKLHYQGVCMSEHYGWSVAKEGVAFGHEPVGTVVKVGKNITKFKVGDRVTGYIGGGMSEYGLANQEDTYLIPDNVKDEDATAEPLACLISAVSKVPLKFPGEDSVAVVGCGYMGCGAISLLKIRGVGKIVAVDINRESLKNALKYGADEAYTPDELPAHYTTMNGNADKTGFKYVMEWGETAESLDTAIRMTRQCGFLGVGAYHTGGKRLVDVQLLNVRAIDMLSTHPREGDIMQVAFQKSMDMLSSGLWKYKNLPVKIYPMDKFDLAHEEITSKYGKYMKALIDLTAIGTEPYILNGDK